MELPSQYRRGADFERKLKKEYEAEGALVVRSAGSKGPIDLVVVGAGFIWFIQCKIRKPTAAERRNAQEAAGKYHISIHLVWPEGQEVITSA